MKVLFATYPMAFHTPGGGEIQLLAYKKYLERAGVKVTLFDAWNPKFEEYDLVHFFSCIGGSQHFCQFIKKLNLPLVVSSSLWITEKTKYLYPLVEIKNQLSLADFIVTNSKLESKELSRILELDQNKFYEIYNAIEESFAKSTDPLIFRKHFDIHDKFILNVGNIEPRKNQLLLAEAVKNLVDYKLVLIGHIRDQIYFDEVLKISPNKIIYLQAINNDNILLRSAYSACDVFALPSKFETPGLAALEAQAQDAPIVITSHGSTHEYFGEDVIYINPEDSSDILRGILESLDQSVKLSNISVKNKYIWSDSIKNLIDLYIRTLNK